VSAGAAAWFIYNINFIPEGAGVIANSGNPGGLDGDPGAVAITRAALGSLFAIRIRRN
jgi:hypothetical protein